MARRDVLLSGEHATLPQAELLALLAVHDPEATVRFDQGVARVEFPAGHESAVEAGIARMAMAHQWGTPWAAAPDTPEGHARLADAVRQEAPGKGSAAVVTERRGHGKSPNSMALARQLGAALQAAGHSIDLKQPEHTVHAWFLDGRVEVGLLGGLHQRKGYGARETDRRAHFKPVSMHPRLARTLLHLARVKPGGRVLDPFCGTGGFLLEAALEGYDAWGSDLDGFMVQGTLQTLTDAGPDVLDGTVFEADIGDVPSLVADVDGIVTDFPYGRASGTNKEALADLYDRALAVFAEVLPKGGYAVVGHPDPELLAPGRHGLVRTELHTERVHNSLTRCFAVLRKE